MDIMRLLRVVLSPIRPFALFAALSCAPATPVPITVPTATSAAISPADLRVRLSILADDSMQGRKAGTLGNMKATDYIAAEAQRIGLKPAGDSGGWFQTVPIVQREISPATGLEVDDTAYAPWTDFIPRDQGKGARSVNGVGVVFGGILGDSSRSMITDEQAAGKLVLLWAAPGPDSVPTGTVNRAATTALFNGAAGIAVATLDAISRAEQADLREGGATLVAGDSTPIPAFMYVSTRFAKAMLNETLDQAQPGDVGKLIRGELTFTEAPPPYPARNVVALLPGSDRALRGQMVALGAHSDHMGIAHVAVEHDSLRAFNRVMRPHGAGSTAGVPTPDQQREIDRILDSLRKNRPARLDSISNGADDDGSGSVALLEIAEAMVQSHARPKRSVLFVWHTGEELGLLGSDWFTRHPTVPRDSIVAQLNMDMIGRGGATDTKGGAPGYLMMIGSRRLSTELGDLIEQVNREGKHGFQFDYTYDAAGHPINAYCRSDHYMYARFGIPVAFFTTGGHQDYHQVTDEVQYIDFAKMARVAGLVEASALAVANLDHPVVVDGPRPDPKAACKQ
jgi:hypothetical protein